MPAVEPTVLPRRFARSPQFELACGLRVLQARGFAARLLGLALLDELPPRHALLIPGCRSVHTAGMRFALDVAFLNGQGEVLRLLESVPPRRMLACRQASAVLELRGGESPRLARADQRRLAAALA